MTSTYMPFFIGDYLKNTQRLSTEEHGAYMLLIMDYWINGPVKNDKKTLKNITKISSKKLQNILSFFEEKNGLLIHSSIERIKQEAEENHTAASEKARNAAVARWGKSNAPSIAQAMPEQCPSPSPSPSPDGIHDIKSNSVHKTSHLSTEKKTDVLKTSFDIISLLKDSEITKAKQVSPTYDFYDYLVPTFNKVVKSGQFKIPDKPYHAFASWIKSYTRGKEAS